MDVTVYNQQLFEKIMDDINSIFGLENNSIIEVPEYLTADITVSCKYCNLAFYPHFFVYNTII